MSIYEYGITASYEKATLKALIYGRHVTVIQEYPRCRST